MTTAPTIILSCQTRLMTSTHSGRTYRITVALPYAYVAREGASWPFDAPLEKWPVVYVTDANWYFGMVTDIVRSMSWCGRPTDAIVVGIGYEEDADPQESWKRAVASRQTDFTPVRDEKDDAESSNWLKRKVESGGADGFLQFIKQELIPTIEREFNADPQRRILLGHSLGGLFAAHALFAEPGLFESYIIGSPALGFMDRYVFKQEAQFAREHSNLQARVHLWIGELEETADSSNGVSVSSTVQFAALLESRKYVGLTLIKRIFAEENHCEVIAPGIHAALKWALGKRG